MTCRLFSSKFGLYSLPTLGESVVAEKALADSVADWLKARSYGPTQVAYSPGQRAFIKYCEEKGVPAVPASDATVASFLAVQADRKYAASTVCKVLPAVIANLHVLRGGGPAAGGS